MQKDTDTPPALPDSWREPTPDGAALAMVDFPSVLLVGTGTLIQRHVTKPVLETLSLSVPEWRLLAFLHENGRSVAGEIASHTWMDKAQISRVLETLVERSLVRREADPLHRQRQLVDLTAKGRRLHAQAFKATRRLQSELLLALSPSERKGLFGALNKLRALAEAAGTAGDQPMEASAPKTAKAARKP